MKFFRRIREKYLADGKISQYLTYASGEIILVVIGILIALQINNWNLYRIERKTEHTYLAGLYDEFNTSKIKLQELIQVNQKNYENAVHLLEYCNTDLKLTDEVTLSGLMYETFANDISYNPNNSLLIEIIHSGNLKNLSNNDLRKQLTNWISTLEDIAKQETDLAHQRENVLKMFQSDAFSLKTILSHSKVLEILDVTQNKAKISNLSLLQSTAFENNLLMFILSCNATGNAHYFPLMEDLNSIITLIKKELQI